MKKSVLFSVIAIMMLAFICFLCAWEVRTFEEKKAAQSQKIIETFEFGDLFLVVETDRTVYDLYDYVHVTATLRNNGEQAYTFSMPTTTRGVHKELETKICQGDNSLTDVDTHIMYSRPVEGTFTLEPGEQYVQTMRFSNGAYNNQTGNLVYGNSSTNVRAGIYQGTVTAKLMIDGEIKLLTAAFEIELNEK